MFDDVGEQFPQNSEQDGIVDRMDVNGLVARKNSQLSGFVQCHCAGMRIELLVDVVEVFFHSKG